jgi:hypothetical protein
LRVSVESAEGAGTTFGVFFPAVTAAAPCPPPAPAGGEAAAGTTVLVVDDEPAVLAATARIVRRAGYATLEAANGEEALSLAAVRDGELVLIQKPFTAEALLGKVRATLGSRGVRLASE